MKTVIILLLLFLPIFSFCQIVLTNEKENIKKPACFFDDDDLVYTKTQIPATFIGPEVDLKKFILTRLDSSLIRKNGAKRKKYIVTIRFIVFKDGSTCDFAAESKNRYGLEQEVIRILKTSSQWSPAIQNGIFVPSYTHQTIEIKL